MKEATMENPKCGMCKHHWKPEDTDMKPSGLFYKCCKTCRNKKKQYQKDHKEDMFKWRQDNQDKLIKYSKKYKMDNREILLEYSRQYQRNKTQKIFEQGKQCWENHRRKISEKKKYIEKKI